MSYPLNQFVTPEEYISKLEDIANKDMFDPRRFSFDAILQYLDQLIQVAKGCTLKNNLNDGYIGFRRFQIVLNCLQQHNLYNPEDKRIQSLNIVTVWILDNI